MISLHKPPRLSLHILLPSARYPRLQDYVFRKAFSSSVKCNIRTVDMKETDWKRVKVNRDRLWRELHETCKWGKGERWGTEETDVGMSRLALSDFDKQARDWFVETTVSLGCKVHIDEMGNIFAIRPGAKEGPATFAGSHLDTQPTGGRYDGILGIHAGIEALKTMNDLKIETEYPTGVINWTNEEGARFPISMVASGVWADEISLEKAYNLQEVGGGIATQKSELERIGYLGSVPCSNETGVPIAAHFELHIEQGPILESSGGKIGAVEGVQAYKWFTIAVKGRDCHTGTTNFSNRSDALLTASKLIVHSHNKASELGCLASTGILNLRPGSTNTVPGFVTFSLDIRSKSDSKLAELEEKLKHDFKNIAKGEVPIGLGDKIPWALLNSAKIPENLEVPDGQDIDFLGELDRDYRGLFQGLDINTAKALQNAFQRMKEKGTSRSPFSDTLQTRINDLRNLVNGEIDQQLKGKILKAIEDLIEMAQKKSIAEGLYLNAYGTPGKGCTVSWQTDSISPAILFHPDCISCVEKSAASILESDTNARGNKLVQRMISGAGHDSVYVSKRSPTSMIFVPCRDGVSHHPAEYCSQEDCGNGADVLLGAVLRYDRLRVEKSLIN